MGYYDTDMVTTRRYSLKLNRKTDRELIEQLDKQENVQAYIKRLIQEDIEKAASE